MLTGRTGDATRCAIGNGVNMLNGIPSPRLDERGILYYIRVVTLKRFLICNYSYLHKTFREL